MVARRSLEPVRYCRNEDEDCILVPGLGNNVELVVYFLSAPSLDLGASELSEKCTLSLGGIEGLGGLELEYDCVPS